MNPMTNVRNVTKLSDRELKYGDGKTSWHDQYKDSAWVFIGGLPYDLTEGDIIAVFSQYGEPVNLNLIRDKSTGKSKGFAFLCYENQKSTVLAVDNFNGIKILGRTLRVDHVENYKVPKDNEKVDDLTRQLWKEGCAPSTKFGAGPDAQGQGSSHEILDSDEDNYVASPPPRPALPSSSSMSLSKDDEKRHVSEKRRRRSSSRERKSSKKSKKPKKSEKKKKKKKHHKKRSRRDSSSSSSSSNDSNSS